jgi:methyl-accepting chemotaxis protein
MWKIVMTDEVEQLKSDFHDFQLTIEEILFGMDTRLNEIKKDVDTFNNNSKKLSSNLERTSVEIKQVRDAMDNGFELAFRKISEK